MQLETGPLTYFATPLATAICGFIVAILMKRKDYRAAAEADLIKSGPEIIRELNIVRNQMQAEINALWKQHAECQSDLENMRRIINERDFAIRECEQKIVILEYRLKKHESDRA